MSVVDNRTGKIYEIPVESDVVGSSSINATKLRQIKLTDSDLGVLSYDPGFVNTASCKSAITFIDGAKGILRYRGYPIEELAKKASYLEVAYLIINGELPNQEHGKKWFEEVSSQYTIHDSIKKIIGNFHTDAHPMGIMISMIAALSTIYPDAKNTVNHEDRQKHICHLIAKIPTLVALAHRQSKGLPHIQPNSDLSYTENFLNMVSIPNESSRFDPDPVLSKALEVLFILHADHEQNCSTSTVRMVGSSRSDPYSVVSAGAAALYGSLHGGANEEVVNMLNEIGDVNKVPDLIRQVKNGKRKLMGFGHRVYKSYDPRAKIIKKISEEVFKVTGRNPLIDIATELERIALDDEYFITRKLYPNVDFYSGITYQAMGFPPNMFTALFAIPRVSGWLAHWQESVLDEDQRIARPRQVYSGEAKRSTHLINNDLT